MAKQIMIDGLNAIPVTLSVRDLVEFIERSGDLDNRSGHRDADAMQEGAKMHRKIQKQQPSFYRPEVTLADTCVVDYQDKQFAIHIEGRADGILSMENPTDALECPNEELALTGVTACIDEIKCVLRDLSSVTSPVPVHLSQAKCYAYFYASQNELEQIGVQMTYCSLETQKVKYFTQVFSFQDLSDWYYALCREYSKWAHWEYSHNEARNQSIQMLDFPFPYRPGQRELAAGVYRTILREKRLFIEAPTGVGKTISSIYPSIRAMGEGLTTKLFYLTAKTITRTVAEDTFKLLLTKGLNFLPITLTAKEKICILDKPDCNPVSCPRAKGHFDRVNEAIFDMLTALTTAGQEGAHFSRELLVEYADKYEVCPYEMSLDVALFMDAVICDYNYAFDPTVSLRRFFAAEKKPFTFLIDEAHNLVDRAREMYSGQLVKENFLAAKRSLKTIAKSEKVISDLEACNRKMLDLKRECVKLTLLPEVDVLIVSLMRLLSSVETLMSVNHGPLPDEVIDLYFDVRHFLAMHDQAGDNYLTYENYTDSGEFFVRLQCMNPALPLRERLDKGRAAIFFSATLLPVRYYMEQLGGDKDDYAIYADTPFDSAKRKLLIAGDVDTRYANRGEASYRKIAAYLKHFVSAKQGNYFVFFPSYAMLREVAPLLQDEYFADDDTVTLLVQQTGMSEAGKEQFLDAFAENTGSHTLLGLCVMGGIFSEGIDLQHDRLIGAAIISPGLPQFGDERELFRNYYQETNRMGFEYAYLYPGMNKVLQSAGRVIRTTEDVGCILLMDERFLKRQYTDLFPREWFPFEAVQLETLPDILNEFWNSHGSTGVE